MKRIIFLICLFSIYICQEENKENIQKALLIKTNLTKEELTQLLEANSEDSNTSVEEVEPEKELETESVLKSLKNGKLKIKIKFEVDLKNKEKKESEEESEGSIVQTAFIQTSMIDVPKKLSLFKCILTLLISVCVMSLFVLSSHFKKKTDLFLKI